MYMKGETQTQVSEAPKVMLAGFVATASVGADELAAKPCHS